MGTKIYKIDLKRSLLMGRAEWSADGRYLPEVDPHTKAKHKILEEYIENLIITLYGKGRYGVTTFTFIDAFCGGGMYRDPETGELWEGSPIRIIRAVQKGFAKSRRKYPLNVNYIFMDSNKNHLDCLRNYSIPKAELGGIAASEQCLFEHGEFEDRINWLIFTVSTRKGHSLFLLDPFGWTQVSMESIRKINSLPGSEIIYTYMIDFIARFIEQRNDVQFRNFQNVLEAEGYYLRATPSNIETVGEQCYLRNESMKLFRERGKAKYVFTFSLISRGNHRVLYYLMHMSNNLTALEVIKESFWKENTLDYEYYFELYGYGFRSADYYQESQLKLRFDINKDSDEFCIDKLENDIGKLIEENLEGISFRDISHRTMERNPASRKHYTEYLNRRRNAQEFEVLRKDQVLTGSNILFQRGDIVRVARTKQLFLFDL
jgi:three-Cys-motif partner protein